MIIIGSVLFQIVLGETTKSKHMIKEGAKARYIEIAESMICSFRLASSYSSFSDFRALAAATEAHLMSNRRMTKGFAPK